MLSYIHMSAFISVKKILHMVISNILGSMGILLLGFVTFENEGMKKGRQVFVLSFGISFELSALIILANNLTSFLYLRRDLGRWGV